MFIALTGLARLVASPGTACFASRRTCPWLPSVRACDGPAISAPSALQLLRKALRAGAEGLVGGEAVAALGVHDVAHLEAETA